MTKVLLVDSDGDFGVLMFEETNLTIQGAFDLAKDSGGIYEHVVDDGVLIYKAYEFKEEISDEFLMFIRDEIQDYDRSKHKNFYVIR